MYFSFLQCQFKKGRGGGIPPIFAAGPIRLFLENRPPNFLANAVVLPAPRLKFQILHTCVIFFVGSKHLYITATSLKQFLTLKVPYITRV